jgi:hypothetical protein
MYHVWSQFLAMRNLCYSLFSPRFGSAPHHLPLCRVRNASACRNGGRYATLLASAALMVSTLQAQTIRVDITPAHATNSFVPKESLGAGVDRIPVDAIDHDFTPATLTQVFAAGWQPMTYRQNTDLAVEAWHWNPEGTWSGPGEQGYFTGSTDSTRPHPLFLRICVAASRRYAQRRHRYRRLLPPDGWRCD